MKRLIVYTTETCSMRAACETVLGKWKLPTLYVLAANGTLRYNEIKKALGITNVMLSNTLKEMEADGLILRVQYNEIPPRVEYSLTELSQELIPAVQILCKWGDQLLEMQKSHECSCEQEEIEAHKEKELIR